MVFPQSGTAIPRHPSQLYELLLEGIVLFIVLWLYARKDASRHRCRPCSWSAMARRASRPSTFREPDSFLGTLALHMTMGQWLCIPMILGGVLLWVWAETRAEPPPAASAQRRSTAR
jgi:phosphatidylglycerol:prolipoprotein diacylglycerol transferase